MSSREKPVLPASLVGVGNHYRNIIELVEDKKSIDRLAVALEISPRHVCKDSCDQWTIFGKSGQLQTADDETYLLYVASYSSRKWGAIKRKANLFGWQVVQDGDDEGTLLLRLPNETQAKFLRSLLGLRTRRGRSETAHLKNGVSQH